MEPLNRMDGCVDFPRTAMSQEDRFDTGIRIMQGIVDGRNRGLAVA